jgi:hypothetical protein
MNIIRAYLDNKLEDEETLYLFKCGGFYIALNDDVLLLKDKGYDLKVTTHSNIDIKVGFPIGSKEKYEKLFQDDGLNYKFIDEYEPVNYCKAFLERNEVQ